MFDFSLMVYWIPVFVTLMILYDWSIHLVYFFGKENIFLVRKINYWPNWSGKKYQTFWTLFWGTAFVLMVIYLLAN